MQSLPEAIRVLHVDDGQDQLNITELYLGKIDPMIILKSVTRPGEALRLLKSDEYDCVLSDFKMGDMDGIEFSRRVKELTDVPFIVYTGQGSEAVAESAFLEGVDDYIRKELRAGHFKVLAKRIRIAVEKYRTEERLRESERELSRIIESSPDAIISVDSNWDVTRYNPAFLKILGLSPADDGSLTENLVKFIHPEDLKKVMADIDAIIEERMRDFTTTFRWVDAKGETVWLESKLTLRFKGGVFMGLEAIARDITKRVKAEEHLKDHTKELARLVEERTQELLSAERMVAAGQVAAMVGHDLRGPLQSIKNAVFMLKANHDEPEMLGIIDEAVNRAVQMLEELRNKTRKFPITMVLSPVEPVITSAVNEAAIPDNFTVEVDTPADLGLTLLDPSKMRRVMDNLIQNAVEAMPQGGKLHVKAGRTEEEIRVSVSDTGEGIPPEKMKNLFRTFYTTKSSGLGLGLNFCKQTVEAHGGSISVESVVGKGTTFTIILPLQVKRSPSASVANVPIPSSQRS